MNTKTKIIGIDPDVEKSGVCYLYTPTKQVEVAALDFPHLLEYLSEFEADCNVVVVVEAGWQNEISNYHKGIYSRSVGEKIGLKVGRNQQVGHCIVEMCKFWKIPVIEKAPLKKMWSGTNRKITHEELSQFVSGLPSRTSCEMRDAVLLAWDYAGFPMRIMPKREKVSIAGYKAILNKISPARKGVGEA